MLGLAVVDAPVDGPSVKVWLVAHTSGTWTENTNAVTLPSGDVRLVDRVIAMVADRVVFLTPGTPATGGVVDAAGIRAANRADLHAAARDERARLAGEFAAETARRRTKKIAALIEPAWPDLPDPNAGARNPDAAAALVEADRLRAVWSTWLRLEDIRTQRPYLTPGGAETRELPPAFVQHAVVHPLPARA